MSAEILRRAASLMRKRAERVPQDPDEEPWFRFPVEGVASAQWTRLTGSFPAESAHIASWHPAVALAVADWLEKTAVAVDHGGSHALFITEAVTVARAYLGESA